MSVTQTKAERDREWVDNNRHRKAWLDQRANAKKRGIPFHFDYECWIEWWGSDISNRGCRTGNLVMARFGDAGAYVTANVYKSTAHHNCKLSADATNRVRW